MLQPPCPAPSVGAAARRARSRFLRWLALGATASGLLFLLWSCNSHPLQVPTPDPTGELAQYREINPTRKVDIIFVIDNSGSMSEEQGNLARNFPVFMDELAGLQGADFQIASVSSDLGAGAGSTNDSCAQSGGDRGVFCSVKGMDFCTRCGVDVSRGRFLRTINPNYQGNIRSVFTCMSTFGTTGCAIEHSIGALRNALLAPENAGFIREDAYLAFVILTDEDDCTAPANSPLFAMPRPGQEVSLICALEAHVCGGAHNTGMMAVDRPLAECQAASDGGLIPLSQMVTDILAIKKDPARIIAAGIFGWPLPGNEAAARYQIQMNGNNLASRPVCSSAGNGSAVPGIRVKRFVESFPTNSVYSICQNDFREVVKSIAQKIRVTVGDPCVTAPLMDINPATAALEVDCTVTERRPLGNNRFDEVVVPQCKGGETAPCWQLSPLASCSKSGYQLDVDRKGAMPIEGTRQSIRCLTCPTGNCRML
jgi:hypothetical protein